MNPYFVPDLVWEIFPRLLCRIDPNTKYQNVWGACAFSIDPILLHGSGRGWTWGREGGNKGQVGFQAGRRSERLHWGRHLHWIRDVDWGWERSSCKKDNCTSWCCRYCSCCWGFKKLSSTSRTSTKENVTVELVFRRDYLVGYSLRRRLPPATLSMRLHFFTFFVKFKSYVFNIFKTQEPLVFSEYLLSLIVNSGQSPLLR